MKKQYVSLLAIMVAVSGFLFSCGDKMNKNTGSLEFDSIQVNETAHLFSDTARPACNLVIDFTYPVKASDELLKDTLNKYFTVPQGITAVLNYNAEEDVDTNEETMLEAIKCVKTGQVTYAVRDTHIDDKEIHEGDIMGIGDAGILAVGKSVDGTTKDMLAQLVNDDSELISLYYGEEVSEEEAEKLTAEIEELYPDMDVDAHMGGQPIYYYVLAVE